jgi:hypothetical protein
MDSWYNSIFGGADMITYYERAKREARRRDQECSSSTQSARDKHVSTWRTPSEIPSGAQSGQADTITESSSKYAGEYRYHSQEVKRRDQGCSSSPWSARDKHVSTWVIPRDIPSGAHLSEQYDQKEVKLGEEPWESIVGRLSPSRQDIIKGKVVKGWAKFLCEDLIDMDDCYRYRSQFEEIIDESTMLKLVEKVHNRDIDRSARQEMLQLTKRLLAPMLKSRKL